MDQLRNRYNPEYFYTKAISSLDTISGEEVKAWYDHPCTVSLRNSLEGDLSTNVLGWFDGAFDEKQEEPLARGRVKAINDILNHIEDMKQLRVEED